MSKNVETLNLNNQLKQDFICDQNEKKNIHSNHFINFLLNHLPIDQSPQQKNEIIQENSVFEISQQQQIDNQNNNHDSELTIQKGYNSKQKKKQVKKQNPLQGKNIITDKPVNQITILYGHVYSYKDSNQFIESDEVINNQKSKKQININFHMNMMASTLISIREYEKILSLKIEDPGQKISDSLNDLNKLFQLNLNNVSNALFKQEQQMSDNDQTHFESSQNLIEKIINLYFDQTDIYIKEIEKIAREKGIDLSKDDQKTQHNQQSNIEINEQKNEIDEEYENKLKEFYNILLESKSQRVDQTQISNDNVTLIEQGLQFLNKENLSKVIDKLNENNFRIDSFLSRGGQADILRGYQLTQYQTKQECVYRCIKFDSKSYTQQKYEYDLVKQIQKPLNVIQYINELYLHEEQIVVFIVEKCEFSLYEELWIPSQTINQFQLCQIIFDLIEGLNELHTYNIIHKDIKPQNILKSNKGYYVYSDFGFSSKVENKEQSTRCRGFTKKYSSPEQKNGKNLTYKTDIYSLGRTIIVIVEKIIKTCDKETKEVGEKFKQLAEEYMLQNDVNKRYDCLQLLDEFHEQIFKEQFKEYLRIYLKKIEQLIIDDYNLDSRIINMQPLKDRRKLKNFDEEYQMKVIKMYCILQMRITLFLRNKNIEKQQLEKYILEYDLEQFNFQNNQVAFSLLRLGDIFMYQNQYENSLVCYKQSLDFYLELKTRLQVDYLVEKIVACFVNLQQFKEGLEFLLILQDLHEQKFENYKEMSFFFSQNIILRIKNFCELFVEQENDLKNLQEGFEYIKSCPDNYLLYSIMFLKKLIKIYEGKNDFLNQLKYYVEFFTMLNSSQDKSWNQLLKQQIKQIIKLHFICKQDLTNFLLKQLELIQFNPNEEARHQRRYLLYLHLIKQYYKLDNIETSLDDVQSALLTLENNYQLDLNQERGIYQIILNHLIQLNRIQESQQFIIQHPHIQRSNK